MALAIRGSGDYDDDDSEMAVHHLRKYYHGKCR
jgi:hypothetical protein